MTPVGGDGIARSRHPLSVRSGSIVLKKSLLADEQKFLGPLMRLVRGDVKGTTS
jgi:hypothetical protein